MSFVARTMIIAEAQTARGLATAVGCLLEGASAMSRYQYLANITEIATELAQVKKVSADDIFRTLASLPREKVPEHIQRML